NDVGAERREATVDDGARLEVADVVGRVVHELHGADAAPVRLLEPLDLAFEEVESFDVDDDGRLRSCVGGAEIRHGERAADARGRRKKLPQTLSGPGGGGRPKHGRSTTWRGSWLSVEVAEREAGARPLEGYERPAHRQRGVDGAQARAAEADV